MDDQESLEARFEEIDLDKIDSELSKMESKLTIGSNKFNELRNGVEDCRKRMDSISEWEFKFPCSAEEAKYQLESVKVSLNVLFPLYCDGNVKK